MKEFLFRASGNGALMTDPQAKADKDAGKLSATAITRCIEIYAQEVEGRTKEIDSRYIRKGNQCEEDSLTLLSILEKKMYRKNEVRYENEFIRGTPDIVTDIIEDVKTCWDRITFLKKRFEKLDSDYYWQAQSYLDLTGKELFKLRYCLVNATPELIDSEKKKVFYSASEGADIVAQYVQIERNMIFDMEMFRKQHPDYSLHTNVSEWTHDIPAKKRLYTIEIPRNNEDITRLYERIGKAREWIKTNLMP